MKRLSEFIAENRVWDVAGDHVDTSGAKPKFTKFQFRVRSKTAAAAKELARAAAVRKHGPGVTASVGAVESNYKSPAEKKAARDRAAQRGDDAPRGDDAKYREEMQKRYDSPGSSGIGSGRVRYTGD